KPRSLRLEVRKLRLKIFLPLPRSNTRRTCCCPGHSTRKPRSYRLEARTLHLDPGLLPLEGLRTTLDIVKKKNRESKRSQIVKLYICMVCYRVLSPQATLLDFFFPKILVLQ
ncbi:unnamed protein product, partial [Nesidiocoris tenuis]